VHLGLGTSLQNFNDEWLRFVRQLGVTHVFINGPRLGHDGVLEFDELLRLAKMAEAHGLELGGIENLPQDHWDEILHFGEGRHKQLENVCRTLENMARAGFPVLGYYFSIVKVWGHWRSYQAGGGRGDAGIKSFDYELVKDAPPPESGPVSVDEMWKRLQWFLEGVVPTAERVGVKLAAHQDDPPVEYLRGVGRLLTSHDAMQKLIDLVPSDYSGLEFCQGTVAEMNPDTVLDAISRFARQGKIFYVHFRNIRGCVPAFDEVFIDDGQVDMLDAMRAYSEAGFDGVITPDHSPKVTGDSDGLKGRAFALGYMRAAMQMVEKE
jgi:mannonate dehydratase